MITTRAKVTFLVEGTVEGEQAYVIGRCGESPIRRGDVFAMACRYRARQSLEEFDTPPEILTSCPVSLRVIEIRAYDRPLDELGPGMTGSLVLSGEGMGRIGPGTVLAVPDASQSSS
jgi:hypothetical protein